MTDTLLDQERANSIRTSFMILHEAIRSARKAGLTVTINANFVTIGEDAKWSSKDVVTISREL